MTFLGTLYPYQRESVDKMVDRGQMLLGLTMGAGKTATSIAAIEELHDLEEVDRVLVVVPSSLKYQWAREIKKFTDARSTVIDGSAQKRSQQWRSSLSSRYVIVNPESLLKDHPYVERQRFDAMVVDEATILKSRTSKRSRMVKKLAKPIFYRFALTGQPIENRPEELFSIMEFVDTDVLGKFTDFDRTFIVRDRFGKPTRYKNLDKLHSRMGSVLIRKTREDIADQLPQIIHQTIPVRFDPQGAMAYRRIATDLLTELQNAISTHGKGFNIWAHYNGGDGDEAQGQIMSRLTVLRMLCDNPELVRASATSYNDPSTKEGSAYAADIVADGWLNGVSKAPKLESVLSYIEEVLEEDPNNKVVLFSFFKQNLRLIKAATSKLTDSVLFMGGMNAEERDAAKQRFATDPKCRLFLSSDAGGYGVDLPMANYCVYSNTMILRADLQWVPAKELRPGDQIVGVEEHRRGKGLPRRFEIGTVTTNTLAVRPCVKVSFSNGESLTVTPDHLMLVNDGDGWTWRKAEDLLSGWKVSKAFDTWKPVDTFDGGWVSGMLDGEGCISRVGNGLALSMSQNPGPVLDKFLRIAHEHGFDFRNSGRKHNVCQQYILRGGKPEVARFLGTFGSVRLTEKWKSLVGNHKVMAVATPAVVSVTPCGEQEISILNTTCRTYIAEGYVQHNCISYDLPWSSGKLEQRESRIIRLSSTFPHVTIATFVMAGSIEERQYEMLQQKRSINEAFVDGKHHDVKGGFDVTLGSLSEFLRSSDL